MSFSDFVNSASQYQSQRQFLEAHGFKSRSSLGLENRLKSEGVTTNETMASAYLDFIEQIIGFRPNVHPNKRDGAWNIMVANRNAKKLATLIYGDASFCMQRKKDKATEIISL